MRKVGRSAEGKSVVIVEDGELAWEKSAQRLNMTEFEFYGASLEWRWSNWGSTVT